MFHTSRHLSFLRPGGELQGVVRLVETAPRTVEMTGAQIRSYLGDAGSPAGEVAWVEGGWAAPALAASVAGLCWTAMSVGSDAISLPVLSPVALVLAFSDPA
jgi:hypothetical protein